MSSHGSNSDDEDENRHDLGVLGRRIEKNASVQDDKLKIFAFEIPVGDPQVAAFLRSGVTWATNEIAQNGAKYAREKGEKFAKTFLSENHAGKVGTAAYNAWLFGLPVADLGFGIGETVKNGFKAMYELREQAQPLLAANHQGNASVGGALTTHYGVLAHARSKIAHDMKADIFGELVKGLRILPGVIMGIQRKQMDAKYPEHSRAQMRDDESGLGHTAHEAATSNGIPDMMEAHNAVKSISKKEFWDRLRNPKSLEDYEKNLKSLRASPAYIDFASGILGRRISDKQMPEDAWDRIVALGHSFKKDNRLEEDTVKEKVQEIFEQRVLDLGRTYKLEGSSYEKTAKIIAEAIVQDKLHPQALAEILDNKKIVTFGNHDAEFGDSDDVRHQVDKMVMKYNKVHVEKEIYHNAPFTKKTLAETYHKISDDEKPFFTLLFPPGVLENAGIKHEEVRKYRNAGKQEFVDQLTDMLRLVIGKGHDELVKEGVKGKYIEPLEDMEKAFRKADKDGEASEYVRENLRDVTKVMRNITGSAKKPGEMWKEFLARGDVGREEGAPKAGMDHAKRESGDEMQVGI